MSRNKEIEISLNLRARNLLIEEYPLAERYLNPYVKGRDILNCKVALYNHKGWFGDPLNQIDIIKALPNHDLSIVYNFHHGHEHIDNFNDLAESIMPYLSVVNLNGMRKGGPKILPIGQGDDEREMIQILLDKGYSGPWGVLGHVEDADVKYILNDNINGLKSLYR